MRASSKQAEPDSASSATARAFPRSRVILYSSIVLIGACADLVSKTLVFRWLGEPAPPGQPLVDNTRWLWEGYFGCQTAVNTGALFGIGQGGSRFFAGLSIIAAVGILSWLFYFGAARERFLTIALALITGGILGNLYDRLGLWENVHAEHDYGVRDWILMQIPGYPPWPNYNIADCLLVCGATMLMWHAVWVREPQPDPHRTGAVESS